MSLFDKITAKNFNAFALLSDGECNEGSVWEAMMAASHFKLDNLLISVDSLK